MVKVDFFDKSNDWCWSSSSLWGIMPPHTGIAAWGAHHDNNNNNNTPSSDLLL